MEATFFFQRIIPRCIIILTLAFVCAFEYQLNLSQTETIGAFINPRHSTPPQTILIS